MRFVDDTSIGDVTSFGVERPPLAAALVLMWLAEGTEAGEKVGGTKDGVRMAKEHGRLSGAVADWLLNFATE